MTTTALDIDALRADTPGCESFAHLNNAGCALPPRCVLDAQLEYLAAEARRGGYALAQERKSQLDRVYELGARLVGGSPEHMAYFESATLAWNAAFWSIPFEAGDRILTGRASYVSNALAFLRAQELLGVELVVVEDDEHGQIDVQALSNAVDERTRLIALTHVPTSGGLVNPAAEVGAVARQAGVLYLLDACQSAGQLQLDVEELACDFLSFTGRKYLRGPRGSGMLYASSRALSTVRSPLTCDGNGTHWQSATSYEPREDATRFETFEHSMASKLGLGVAMDYALALGIEAIEARVRELASRLRDELRSVDGVEVHDQGAELCGIVTFTSEREEPELIARRCQEAHINVAITRASSSRFSMSPRGLEAMVRASVHYYNDEDELGRLAALVSA